MEMLLMKPFSPLHILQIKNPKNNLHKLNSQLFGSFRLNSPSPVSYRVSSVSSSSSSSSAASFMEVQKMVQEFNPRIPIEEAITPPSCWYTDPCFYSLELQNVFFRGWQAVGYADLIKEPHQYFTGRLGNVEYVVCRDDSGKLHAFHNVCRHHASLIASGKGKKSCFVCPYHGWTYGLDGALLKATRISGIKNLIAKDMGLVHLRVAIWGPFVLVNFEDGSSLEEASERNFSVEEWLGSSSELLHAGGVDSSLSFVCRREYTVRCNWKVFCDNYLDGGYHVQYAHKGLASGLNLESYSTTIHEKVSIQSCEGGTGERKGDIDRLGSKALYAFVYPNFMINRYGPWMDTNLVLPLGPDKCQVIFDYFLDASLKDDKSFIEKSLKDSEEVQLEDIALSEGVQRGLESPAYNSGRYAPNVEKPMHHFHCLLYDSLNS